MRLPKLSKRTSIFAALLGVAAIFGACKNNNYDNVNTPAVAVLSVVNAYPNTNPLDFYLGSERVNNTGLSFGQNIQYFRVYEGKREANIAVTGTTTSLLKKTVDIQAGNYYSLYIIGDKTETLDYLLTKDNTDAPAAGKAKIRFINLSPDAPALNLVIDDNATKFENIAYKANTEFKDVTAIDKSTITLKNTAGTEVGIKLSDFKFTAGKVYTVWAKGLLNSTTDANKLTVQVTLHN